MNFTYIYKTSDGVRHRAEISAPCREDAFSALRNQGIRPITIFETEVRRRSWRRWAAIAVLSLISMSLLGLVVYLSHEIREENQNCEVIPESITVSPELLEQVAGVSEQRGKSLEMIDFDILKNYALIENLDNIQKLMVEVDKARVIVGSSRAQLKELFRAAYEETPAEDAPAKLAMQVLYARAAEEIDLDEARIDAAELAIILLDENRGRWHAFQGGIIFDDAELEGEFKLIVSQTDAAAIRWRKEMAQ